MVKMNNLVKPTKALKYSDIYLDFINGKETVKTFYPAKSLVDVASQLDGVHYDRRRLISILTKQNREYGASEKTFENIEKLKNESTVCLFSGQQAGLFGGPFLIVIKALAIVKAARQYSKQLNCSVIPVFWIAGDDHDFEEVNHTFVLNNKAEAIKISYDTPPLIRSSTSEIILSDSSELKKAKASLKQVLGETDFTDNLYQMIDATYTDRDTFVSAFGKLMASLISQYGLILFSPGDKEAKRMAVDFFRDIVEKQDELHEYLIDTNNRIKQLGYHLQVDKKENATHLFYNLDGRKPVLREGDKFFVDEKIFTKDELLKCIEMHPEDFSPDVMTRPILQSYLFPVVSQKGGASEIAYLAQVNRLFDLFGLVAPFYKARPSATIVEKKYEKIIDEYKIEFEDIIKDIEQVINKILMETFPEDIEMRLYELRKHIESHFDDFKSTTLKFDTSLESFARQTYGKIDYALKTFEGKVFSAHKKKSKETRERIYRLWHALYPHRNFQERSVNICYFLSKYGFDFIDFLYNKIDCEQKEHQLISFSEYDS